MTGLYVQYGCGFTAPPGWLNFDASPTLRFERLPLVGRFYSRNERRFPPNVRYGDIVKGLPVAVRSCTGIFCSHVLEHLSLEDAHRALDNTASYLAAGGVFRLVVPDLGQLARAYLADESTDAGHAFMRNATLGEERRPRGVRGVAVEWLGNSRHRWMWDEASLSAALAEHGFTRIRRCEFGDAEDVRFREVEEPSRFEGCLALECRKDG